MVEMERQQTISNQNRFRLLNKLVILLFVFVSGANGKGLTIITNSSVNQTTFSQSEIRQIFSARKQFWNDGTRITVYVMDPNSVQHKQFCKEKLNMFPYQLERLWHQITYSGQGDPPLFLNSQEALIKAVLNTPGAIGYAEEAHLQQTNSSGKEAVE